MGNVEKDDAKARKKKVLYEFQMFVKLHAF